MQANTTNRKTKSSGIDISRLCTAIQRSRLMLRRYREERKEMVREYVGYHWSDDGTDKPVPLNLISMYVSIVGRNLIAKNPRLMLSTFSRDDKPAVSTMESWANKEIEHMQLANTLQRIVVDALFSIGIAKTALATPADSAHLSWGVQAGKPFCERVDFDDFVFDGHARDFSECSFIGHRYRVPLDAVKDSKLYSKGRKDLSASTDNSYNLEGDERINTLGTGQYSDQEEFEDFIDLWEIYLPRHRQILTLADDQMTGASAGIAGGDEPLRSQRWLGPETGPYQILSFGVVPGNAMPKGPIQDLIDLHQAHNRTLRKVIRTVDRMKEVTAVAGGDMEGAARVQNEIDGGICAVNDPSKIKNIVTSGNALQIEIAAATLFKDLFNWTAGNLEIVGGLGPQSRTAHQDAMLNENSSKTVSDMQQRTTNFVSVVGRSLCWYWWHDPFKIMQTKHSLPGLPELSITRNLTPQMRKRGRFEDMQIEIDPYSMQHATPQTRMAALDQLVQQTIIPMMPQLQQFGIVFDMNAYLQKKARYMDQPDLMDIITIAEPPQQEEQQGGQEQPKMPANTNRSYTRENIPMRTTQGTDKTLMASMLGRNLGGANESNGQSQNGMAG